MASFQEAARLEEVDAIGRERLNRVLRPIGEASGLPNAAYVDAGHFRRERDEVIGRTWAGLAFADSLPPRPYAFPVDFMGLPLLITRDKQGVLRVFHNVCSHRGIKLVGEPAEVHGVINCRYHCWAYSAGGELKATPHIGGVNRHSAEGFDNARHGLKAVRSAEFMGVIFINLSADAPDFERHIGPLRQRAEDLFGAGGLSELRPGATHSRLVLDVRCNWKLAVENYCEAYHLPWVHPALNDYSRLEDHYCFFDAENFAGQGSLAYRLSDAAGTRLPRLAQWPAERTHVAEYPSLYPNVLLGFQADHAFAIILTPIAPDLTREEVRLLYVGEAAADEAYAGCRGATHASWDVVFREDVFAVEGMQQGRASPGYEGGVFSPVMDRPTHHFHRWVAGKLAEARVRDPR
ncbi:MAG TPA: SRPBCC family protein [Steroidobacteraceae bacterium]|nr:SRPBCC family protein [Steroidobacteraceae bacterium]